MPLSMKLKRNKTAYDFVSISVDIFMNLRYKIECSGSENIPNKGPVLLLPKHQAIEDILIESIFLRKYCKRKGNWMMKPSLPGILDYVGGIKIKRPKDIRKIKNKKERREVIIKAREDNKKIRDYTEFLYKNEEIVVVHPEGTRKKGIMGQLKTELINFTKQIQEKYNVIIPAIPIGIEYVKSFPKSKIYLRAGKTLDITMPNLVDVLEQEIKRLSNL